MKNLKRILIAALLCITVFGMTAFAASSAGYDEMTAMIVEQYANGYFSDITQSQDEQIDDTIDYYEYSQNTVMTNGLNSWKSAKKGLGDLVELTGTDTEYEKGVYTTTINAKFENRDCEFIFAVDEKELSYRGNQELKLEELTFNPVYTTGEKLSQATVNLAVGMGTVFAVLIFLTWVISLFKYVNKAQEKLEQKKSSAVIAETAAPAPAKPAAESTEIQAVIAAAIAAYESECGGFEKQPSLNNGIVIRSYRRR